MTVVSSTVEIRGLLTNSMVEWEDHLCAVVFMGRCNWRCPYCHGAALVEDPEQLGRVSTEEVFALLEKQKAWLDGITISGGEPTLQPGLVDFVRDLKATGTEVKLETNGSRPDVVGALLAENLLDCLAVDFKAPLDKRLESVSCVSPEATAVEAVQETFALMRNTRIECELHTTLCPAFLDASAIADMAAALQMPEALWVLQQYENDIEMLNGAKAGEKRFDLYELEEMERIARAAHPRVLLRKGKGI